MKKKLFLILLLLSCKVYGQENKFLTALLTNLGVSQKMQEEIKPFMQPSDYSDENYSGNYMDNYLKRFNDKNIPFSYHDVQGGKKFVIRLVVYETSAKQDSLIVRKIYNKRGKELATTFMKNDSNAVVVSYHQKKYKTALVYLVKNSKYEGAAYLYEYRQGALNVLEEVAFTQGKLGVGITRLSSHKRKPRDFYIKYIPNTDSTQYIRTESYYDGVVLSDTCRIPALSILYFLPSLYFDQGVQKYINLYR